MLIILRLKSKILIIRIKIPNRRSKRKKNIEVDEADKQRYDKLNLDQINEEFAKVLENNDLSYIRPRVL